MKIETPEWGIDVVKVDEDLVLLQETVPGSFELILDTVELAGEAEDKEYDISQRDDGIIEVDRRTLSLFMSFEILNYLGESNAAVQL